MIFDDNGDAGNRTYEIQQLDKDGDLLASLRVEAASGEAAAKQLDEVVSGTESIAIRHQDEVMNEMDVGYWNKRVRSRR